MMNYLLIEEKAWAEITALAKHMAEKVRQLERHFYPADNDG